MSKSNNQTILGIVNNIRATFSRILPLLAFLFISIIYIPEHYGVYQESGLQAVVADPISMIYYFTGIVASILVFDTEDNYSFFSVSYLVVAALILYGYTISGALSQLAVGGATAAFGCYFGLTRAR